MNEEFVSYLASRGLNPDPEAVSNRGAYRLGQVTDLATRAPWSRAAQYVTDPKDVILYSNLLPCFIN